jgi:hypothetical protein
MVDKLINFNRYSVMATLRTRIAQTNTNFGLNNLNILRISKILKTTFAAINVMSITATEEHEQEQETIEGIPVCASNLSTPVVDTAAYLSEIC